MHVAPSSPNKVLVNKNHLLVCILLPDSKGFFHISLLGYSSVYSRVWRPSKLHAYANVPLFWQINFTSFIPRSHSFSIILLGWRGAGLGHLELSEWYCLICYMIKWLFLREHEVYNKIKTRQKMSIDKVQNCLSGRCFRMHWHLNSFTLSLIFCRGISHVGMSYNYMGWDLRLCWTCGAQESTAINTRKLHIQLSLQKLLFKSRYVFKIGIFKNFVLKLSNTFCIIILKYIIIIINENTHLCVCGINI